MMVSPHFSLGEFMSRDGALPPDDLMPNIQRLAGELETLRRFIGRPIVIVSGYRSPAHNAAVKGAAKSQHMLGKAADVRVLGMTPEEVQAAIESLILRGRMQEGGLGLYRTWCHYDVRSKRARWAG